MSGDGIVYFFVGAVATVFIVGALATVWLIKVVLYAFGGRHEK